PIASIASSLLDDFGPAPSLREPASVGLYASAQKSVMSPEWNEQADCICRPWSALSMNSLPFQVSEWIAPATREVVVMTISDGPALLRITPSPEGGSSAQMRDSPPSRIRTERMSRGMVIRVPELIRQWAGDGLQNRAATLDTPARQAVGSK